MDKKETTISKITTAETYIKAVSLIIGLGFIGWITSLAVGLAEIKTHKEYIRKDVDVLKQDVSQLKDDVREMKYDLRKIRDHLMPDKDKVAIADK